MKKARVLIAAAAALRQGAEKRLGQGRSGQHSKTGNSAAAADLLRLAHELEVFKIELEMQALELEEARDGLAELLVEKHPELHDFSPMGYGFVDQASYITRVNLTGATLLDVAAPQLIHRPLLFSISPDRRPAFLGFLKNIFTRAKTYRCEVTIRKQNGGNFWVKFQTVTGNLIRENPKWHLLSFQNIPARKLATELTSRKLEVLGLIATGKMSKEIAGELNISQKTVEKHRENLMQKLNVHDIAGLTRYAISAGIIAVMPG